MANNYMNSAERAEDNRSSAWTLLVAGGVGLVVIILGTLGIIPLPMSGFSKDLTLGVLGGLCLIFVIAGVISFKKSKVYAEQAAKEGDRDAKYLAFFEENFPAEKIDEMLGEALFGLSEEEQYLKRYAAIRQIMYQNFPEISMEFLEHMSDAVFEKLYED